MFTNQTPLHQGLVRRLDKIRQVKLAALEAQEQEIRKAMLMLETVVTNLETSVRSSEGMEIIDVNKKASDTIAAVQASCGSLAPHEDDEILFRPPPSELVANLSTAGVVVSSGFGPHCVLDGDGLVRGVLGKEAKFSIFVKDHLKEVVAVRGDPPNVELFAPDGRPVSHQVGRCSINTI